MPRQKLAPCPICGTPAKVRVAYLQATRTEPMKRLGRTASCRPCQLSFKVPDPGIDD
jgi:hypothetical protein